MSYNTINDHHCRYLARLLVVYVAFYAAALKSETELSGLSAAPGQTDSPVSYPHDDDALLGVGHSIGPGMLLPGINLKGIYTDNLTRANSNAINTFGTVVSPRLAYVLSDNIKNLTFDYNLENGFFEGSHEDNYLDQTARLGFSYQPTSRIYAAISGIFRDAHDARGTGRAESQGVVQQTLDEWHKWNINGLFAYGSVGAKGRLELEGDYFEKRYDTNRSFTASRDQDVLGGAARFTYRYQQKTFITFTSEIEEYTYPNLAAGLSSLDSTEFNNLIGVKWDATFKTTGFAKIGYSFKKFDSGERTDAEGLIWEVAVDWKPKTYSTVHFETSQSTEETNGTGDAIDQSYYLASWEHFWKPRLSTKLSIGYQELLYDEDDREDKFYQVRASADYRFRDWVTFGLGYRYSNEDSTDDTFNYTENLLEFRVNINFF